MLTYALFVSCFILYDMKMMMLSSYSYNVVICSYSFGIQLWFENIQWMYVKQVITIYEILINVALWWFCLFEKKRLKFSLWTCYLWMKPSYIRTLEYIHMVPAALHALSFDMERKSSGHDNIIIDLNVLITELSNFHRLNTWTTTQHQ